MRPLPQARCLAVPGLAAGPSVRGGQVTTDSLRDRVIAACSAKPGSAENYPFGDEVTVFKVAGKMFALVTLSPAPCSVSRQPKQRGRAELPTLARPGPHAPHQYGAHIGVGAPGSGHVLWQPDRRRRPQWVDLDGYRQDVTRPELPGRGRPW
jgi:hypothetical protein